MTSEDTQVLVQKILDDRASGFAPFLSDEEHKHSKPSYNRLVARATIVILDECLKTPNELQEDYMDRQILIQYINVDGWDSRLQKKFPESRHIEWVNAIAMARAVLGGGRGAPKFLKPKKELKRGVYRLLDHVRHQAEHQVETLRNKIDGPGVTGKPAADSYEDWQQLASAREKSIARMRSSIESTTRNSNGQLVLRTVKNKEARLVTSELEIFIEQLLDLQRDRCALTGIPFQFYSLDSDSHLLPSIDRIDSNGHYEVGNLQIVCQFINFWKNDMTNEDFKRLITLVRTNPSST